jgi:hypothetical protein
MVTTWTSVHASHILALYTLQAPEGFVKAGGFSGVYNGVMATALGAAPGAALFFSAYEGMKPKLQALNGGKEHPLQHSFAASCGEVAACLVRVPTAVVTQRMQVGQYQNYPQAMKARRLCRRAARRAATAAGGPPALGRSSSAQPTAWVAACTARAGWGRCGVGALRVGALRVGARACHPAHCPLVHAGDPRRGGTDDLLHGLLDDGGARDPVLVHPVPHL